MQLKRGVEKYVRDNEPAKDRIVHPHPYPANSFVETLTHSVMVFGNGTFGR